MGREFIELFDDWAQGYDETVTGRDLEYRDVFVNYDLILEKTANETYGHVLEFGVGTGNLTEKLIAKGRNIYGVEPSSSMRSLATNKLKNVTIVDGDFLDFKMPTEPFDSITSTYAFHHLTDSEKDKAISLYSKMLKTNGKVVFADTVFEDEQAKLDMINKAEQHTFLNLAQDLKTEYYTTIEVLQTLFTKHGFNVTFKRMNDFVFLITATKQ
ncbi:class I SAM-dependent DNA methyltransferase [Bacillus solimangrovi]|uniref:Uncharacterized methyltransferase BFG57_08800 n=1 Tax=Bacillus solimangrovi TaxID=1305675 RepID=A0A1E5LJT6_9BACI|nr:class I SAM-dependent methyltransferase [Bacillus solimangrovi]OEH94344.1 SAM-dependent methyltransferase [Bacillus solimangrovi]